MMAATGRWRERWQRLRLLSAREWRLLAESWLLCAAIAVVLPRVSFTRLIDVIEGRQPTPRSSPPVSPERMATLVESAAARVPTSTCLTKSLTLNRLLRRSPPSIMVQRIPMVSNHVHVKYVSKTC